MGVEGEEEEGRREGKGEGERVLVAPSLISPPSLSGGPQAS